MSIQMETLMGIVGESGLKVEDQAAFLKIPLGTRAIYIAKTKKVSRVDLSGFDFSHPAVKKISEDDARDLKLGKVRGQLDFSKSDERVLEAFRTALNLMQHLASTPNDTEIPVLGEDTPKKRRGGRRKKVEVQASSAPKRKPGRPRREVEQHV